MKRVKYAILGLLALAATAAVVTEPGGCRYTNDYPPYVQPQTRLLILPHPCLGPAPNALGVELASTNLL